MLHLTVEREARGWTKFELARRARIHPAELGKIESGRLRPYPHQLEKLARALHVATTDASRLLERVAEQPDVT